MPSAPTTAPPSPNLSSSLASLQSALTASDRARRLLFSPASVNTGDTGSTEEPYSATQELADSVAGHSESSLREQEFASAPDEEGLKTPPRSLKREVSPQLGSRAPSKVDILSDSSWSQLGSPSPNPFPSFFHREEEQSPFLPPLQGTSTDDEEEHHIYIKEEDCSDDGRELLQQEWSETPSAPVEDDDDVAEYCLPITGSQQERADLILRSRRSQSDFSRWLEETMAMAKGSGESVVDSDDALSSIAAATRQARMGLSGGGGATATSLTGSESRVLFEFGSEEGGEDLMEGEQLMWRSDTMPIKLDEEVFEEPSIGGIAEEGKNVEIAPVAVEEQPSTAPASPPSTDRRWRVLSVALAFGWIVSSLSPYVLSVIYVYLFPAPSPPAEVLFSPFLNNSTLATLHLDDFSAAPLPLGPSTCHTLLTALLSFLLFAIYHLHMARSQPIKRPRSRSRSPSPLLELNPSSITEARSLLPLAISAYHASDLTLAVSHFTTISNLACAPADKASAAEWLGRAHYRLARVTGDRVGMEEACRAFEKALRMDGGNASARASLGRAKWRLGEGKEAIKHSRAALKKDEELAFAHESLGKGYASLCATNDSTSSHWILAEQHLRRAVALDPATSYSVLAFLGEQLHTRGRTAEARQLLVQATSMRIDYPAAHARLAFIATEQMDQTRATQCWRMVIASRESGFNDQDLLTSTRLATQGHTPFLSLYFALSSAEPKERLAVLDRARKLYPSNTLLTILHSITQRQAHSTSISTSLDSLRQLEGMLSRRVTRFGDGPAGIEGGDVEGKGLWALCLLGLNKGKQAEKVYEEFWAEMRERKGAEAGEERQLAFLVMMAFYDLKGVKRGQAKRRREL